MENVRSKDMTQSRDSKEAPKEASIERSDTSVLSRLVDCSSRASEMEAPKTRTSDQIANDQIPTTEPYRSAEAP